MKCFKCEKDKEQLLAIDNKELDFKETVCFPCVVKCLRDHKQGQIDEIVGKIMQTSVNKKEVEGAKDGQTKIETIQQSDDIDDVVYEVTGKKRKPNRNKKSRQRRKAFHAARKAAEEASK